MHNSALSESCFSSMSESGPTPGPLANHHLKHLGAHMKVPKPHIDHSVPLRFGMQRDEQSGNVGRRAQAGHQVDAVKVFQ